MVKFKIFSLTILIFCFFSCVSAQFNEFYNETCNLSDIPEECKLKNNEEPQVFTTDNINRDIIEVKSNYYGIIGYASYNGPEFSADEIIDAAKKLCIKKRAKLALVSWGYTDTRNGIINLPNTTTSTTTGNINSFGNFNYTTTSITNNNSISYSVRRYNYDIVLFVLMPEKYKNTMKLGISFSDLDSETRYALKRNTGVLIDTVFKDKPAYYANLYSGDIIIEVNGKSVKHSQDYQKVMESLENENILIFTIIRNGIEHKINIEINK